MLGVVLELFIVEKELLARCKNKLGAAVNALQNSIGEFHGRLPSQGLAPKSAMAQQDLAGSGSLYSFVVHYKGPGPHLKQGGIRTFARMCGRHHTSQAKRLVSDLSRFLVSEGVAASCPGTHLRGKCQRVPKSNSRQKLEKRSSKFERRGRRPDSF
jgi:hypothetical protein